MTFSRIKSNGWAVNEKVTSPQLNQLDIDHKNSLDKTGDSVASGGGVSGEIDFLSGSSLIIDSGSVITTNSGSNINLSGQMHIESGGHLTANSGSIVTLSGTTTLFGGLLVQPGSNLEIIDTAVVTIDSGATLTSSGIVTFATGSQTNLNDGAHLTLVDGSAVEANGVITLDGSLTMATGSVTELQSGSTLIVDSGTIVTVAGTNTISTAGAAIQINDSGNPTFASGRTRYIAQPPIPVPSNFANPPLTFPGYFNDGGSSGSALTHYIYFTKLIGNATMTAVLLSCQNNTGSNITATNATAKLYKMSLLSPSSTATQIGSTQHLGALTSAAIGTLIFSSLSETIDDENNSYCVQINTTSGSGAGSITWFGPQVEITNITYLGQF